MLWDGSAIDRGRSPRTRGRPVLRLPPLILFRSIPAYAGEAAANVRAKIDLGVDPRVRGGGAIF